MPTTYNYTPRDECPMCASTSQRVLGRRLDRHQGLRPTQIVGVATTIVRCGDCGLVFPNPLPLPLSVGDHYDKPPEEYWQPAYFERTFDPNVFGQELARLMPSVRDPKCLDVGAGLGHMMGAMLKAGYDIHGIEPSPTFVERAIANGIPADRLQTAEVEDAVFPDQSFDFIVLSSVLEHLAHPGQVLERVIPWLKPGGMAFVAVPAADWLMSRALNLAYRLQGLDYVTNLSPMHDPYHLSEFTLASFQRHGQRAAYRIASHRRLVCSVFLPKPFSTVAAKVMARTQTGMEIVVWLTPA